MAYGFYASITVDNTKVSGSANLTNFPILVSGTYDGTGGEPDIRTTGNGGNVENTASGGASGSYTVPADLVFSPNTDGSSPYDFEIEKYDATTGEIIAWVEIPTLDYNDDTVLYMVYGDSGVTTSQEDVNGTWGAYALVFHFVETPAGTADEVKDSAGSNHATGAGGNPDSITGKVGNGLDFNSADSEYLSYGDITALDGATRLVIHYWVNIDSIPTNYATPVSRFDDGGSNNGFRLDYQASTTDIRFSVYEASGDNIGYRTTNTPLTAAAGWQHFVGVWDASDNDVDFYVDGSATTKSSIGASGTVTQIENNAGGLYVGSTGYASYYRYTDEQMDEFRISTSESVNADWIATEYNTQSSPSTFYTMGSETAAPSAGPPPLLALTGVGV